MNIKEKVVLWVVMNLYFLNWLTNPVYSIDDFLDLLLIVMIILLYFGLIYEIIRDIYKSKNNIQK